MSDQREIPRILFDGTTVYESVCSDPRAASRTSAENVSDVLDAIVRHMRAHPESQNTRHTAPEVVKELRKAIQLAGIASDWGLGTDGKVEIDGEWVPCFDLQKQFKAALARLEAK